MSQQKTMTGRVVADKMDKTIVVAVESSKRHPLYRKIIRRVTKYKAHDERNECHVADHVKIMETRPLSRDKRWRVVEIISRGEAIQVSPKQFNETNIGTEENDTARNQA
jgi:small subunit ribosomal protein S17